MDFLQDNLYFDENIISSKCFCVMQNMNNMEIRFEDCGEKEVRTEGVSVLNET